MSFYGLAVLLIVLMLALYLSAVMSEVNSLSWIAMAYATVAHSIGSALVIAMRIGQ
ncbi:MAG: hypothetical protein KGI04_00235 [Candidatus Micrarchaeota archaeon]|nr:hypothetical protein [Candidatus Micrarchaeota archaeon]